MAEALLSVGLDVGTTTTQMIVSKLLVENQASAFSVPEMKIASREILYKSPIHFTPLSGKDSVDGDAIRDLVAKEYEKAGLKRPQVDTGAIIITGETSRKENARTVLNVLSDFAGDFVVATAGPHLESVLSAKGAGADRFSEDTGKTVLHMDIGGGTSNLSLIRGGNIVATGCMNIGGRLVKIDTEGRIAYRSAVLEGLFSPQVGQIPSTQQLTDLGVTLAEGLEMAAGLRPATQLLQQLWTQEAGAVWDIPQDVEVLSFSGGVADCIQSQQAISAFGDIGPILGQAIRKSKLCQGQYRLGSETIRATVIGAGCHSTQLSGSTVFHRGISFPLKNLPVITLSEQEQQSPHLPSILKEKQSRFEGKIVLSLPGYPAAHYSQITALADSLCACWQQNEILLAMQADMAKALGHALALRLDSSRPILCIDRVNIPNESYLDVGQPVASALPVVIKTIILSR